MSSIFNIKKSSRVRTTLCVEDVVFKFAESLKAFELIKELDYEGELVIQFTHPFRTPRFNKFYASPIKSVKDRYLPDLINRLYYLNPGDSPLNMKRITEFILRTFTLVREVPGIRVGSTTTVPIITYEELFPVVKAMVGVAYIPDSESVLMFSCSSKLTRGQKISLHAQARSSHIHKLLGESIHTAAEFLIDTKPLRAVNVSRIQSTGLVVIRDTDMSTSSVKRHMHGRTKRLIKEHNVSAPIKSDLTEEKFIQFTNLKERLTIAEIAQRLNISKSTAIKFKQLHYEQQK